ncbi:MAG: hypothetical protein K0Q75_2875 [Anaerospora sp.]|nr:hypothetical protein [Anaerospora sp.]
MFFRRSFVVSKKLVAIILSVFVLAIALAGCGGQADQKQGAKAKKCRLSAWALTALSLHWKAAR